VNLCDDDDDDDEEEEEEEEVSTRREEEEEEEEEEEDLFTLCRLLSRRERERRYEQNREIKSPFERERDRLCASLGARFVRRACACAYPARIRGRKKLFERQEEEGRRRANFHRAFYITQHA